MMIPILNAPKHSQCLDSQIVENSHSWPKCKIPCSCTNIYDKTSKSNSIHVHRIHFGICIGDLQSDTSFSQKETVNKRMVFIVDRNLGSIFLSTVCM